MDITTVLRVGMEFKNMRALCEALNLEYNIHHSKMNRKMVGQYCRFHYRVRNGTLIIDEVFDEIKRANFLSYEFKFNIGDILDRKYGKLRIDQQIRIKKKGNNTGRGYHVTCLICGYDFDISEYHLSDGNGCSVCSHHKILKGYNDMWTTNSELASLLLNPEDGYCYTEHSNKKVDWKCPICGEPIYNKVIESINRQGLSCSKCGDGISYPNKFMYNILSQLKLDFESEKQFDWCRFKKYNSTKDTYGLYDFVIESQKLIIEMDGGLGHGQKTYKNKTSNEESIYKDRMKDRLAQEHGYNVIRVPCFYEDLSIRYDVCKNSVIEVLSHIFDLQEIDWNKAHTNSLNSIVMDVCKMYNNGHSTKDISMATKISITTILDYLQQGSNGGFCNYVSPCKFNKDFLIAQGYVDIKTKLDLTNAKLDFICNYYNDNQHLTAEQIANQLGISNATVWKILKQGTELGRCNYVPKNTRFKKNHVYQSHQPKLLN